MNGSNMDDEDDQVHIERLDRLKIDEKRLLINTWEILGRDMEDLAVRIFQMIFEQSPDAKQMFSFTKTDYEAKEKKSKEFTFHALRFIQVIESTIELLDTPSKLEPLLANLGSMHARHEMHLGFRKHYWSVFVECTIFHFRRLLKQHSEEVSADDLDSAIVLWRLVLHVITDRMKLGFYASVKKRKANRESIIENHIARLNVNEFVSNSDATQLRQSFPSPSFRFNRAFSPRFFKKKDSTAERGSSGVKK